MGRPGALFLASLLLAHSAVRAVGTDLYDIALLSADADNNVNMTPAALLELGWERGVIVNFNNDEDQVETFIRGGSCLITFSSVNDANDQAQTLGGLVLPTVPVCGHDVHAGVAQEFYGLIGDPGYPSIVDFMSQAQCTKAVAAGNSLGGALASLWARCASASAGFGRFTDYTLVTFGAPAVTKAPLDRHAGGAFEGTRYAITEADGGASPFAGLRGDVRTFVLEAVQLLHDVAAAKGLTSEAAQVSALHAALNGTGAGQFEALWLSQAGSLAPLIILSFQEVQANPTGLPAQLVTSHVARRVPTGVLSYEYDPVPVITAPLGFRHPLVDFQPLPNPLLPGGTGAPMAMVPALQAAELPRGDILHAALGIVAYGGSFPNHNQCCYVDFGVAECAQKFEIPAYRTCSNPLLAFLPAEPEPEPPHNYTCGEVKDMYRASECCGRPSARFDLPGPGARNLTCGEVKRLWKASGCCGNPSAPFAFP